MRKPILPILLSKGLPAVLMVFWQVQTWAQGGNIEGIIKQCNTQQPIVGAYVMLCQRTDSSVAVFANTDAQGRYRIQKLSPSQDYFLKITCVGYADTTLSNPTENKPFICLHEKPFDLKEVRVVALIPVKERGDTTVYKVSTFAKNQEQTLEDVLKRLPNVRVEQNGDVFFKNRKIEKIFIEGDNLSGDKYQALTRSIDPALLDEVQAIENFSENKILKSLGGEKETVLNLTIKKERKKMLFGSTDVRAGPRRADATVTLISYLKKTKQLLLTSGNNAGIERAGGLTPYNPSGIEWSGLAPGGQNLFNPGTLLSRLLGTPLENFNNERVLQYNIASPVGKKIRINAGFVHFKDHNQAFPQRETRFISDNPFTFNQIDTTRQNRQLQKAHLQLNIEPNQKTSLAVRGRWHNGGRNIDQQTVFLQQNNVKNIAQQFEIGQQTQSLNAELTRQFNLKNALLIDLHYNNSELNDNLTANVVAPSLAAFFFKSPVINAPLQQHLRQQRNTSMAQIKWFYGDSSYRSHTWAGVMKSQQLIDLQQNTNTEQTQQDLFSHINLLNVGHEGSFKRAKFECNYRFEGSYLNGYFDNTLRTEKWFFQPSVMVSYSTDKQHFWILNMTRKVNYLEGINLLNAPILTDFRTAQNGRSDLMLNPGVQSSLSYLHNDFIKHRMTILGTLFWNKNQRLWGLNDNIFLPEYSLTRIGQVTNLSSYGFNLNVEKLFYSLRGNIKADVSGIVSEFQNQLNGRQRNTVSQSLLLKWLYLSAFEFPINFEISSSHRISLFRNSDENNIENTVNNFTVARQTATLFTKIKQATWRTETDRNVINKSVFWVLNSSLNYPLSKKLQCNIEGRNLLNSKSLSYFELTPISTLSLVFPMLPRFVLVGFKYNF